MLTRQELVQLERSLRATRVLSVYLDGKSSDPAGRTAWRRELDRSISRARQSLRGESHAEREGFERAVQRLERSLVPFHGALRSPAWVGFFPEDGEPYAESLPVPVPTIVAWGDGVRIAPYLRAIERQRPMLVAIVDARAARLYRYAPGQLTRLDTFNAHARVEPPTHMGYPPEVGYHTGTRGRAGNDEAERDRRTATERMFRELADRIEVVAGRDEWIVVGGIAQAAIQFISMLTEPLQRRTRRPSGLDVHSTDAQLEAAASRAFVDASRERDMQRLQDLLAQNRPRGHGSLGPEVTLEALREHAVMRLYLTETLERARPLEAEALVREAIEAGAEIEHLSDVAGNTLDEVGGGIGALLRFEPVRAQVPLAQSVAPERELGR